MNLFMVLAYSAAGIVVLSGLLLQDLPRINRTVIGISLLLYSFYRLWKTLYRSKREKTDSPAE
jgi:FtsH-binding integral membrane protein